MNKETLADIVVKSLRFANSVIDSSYDFPEIDINISKELLFRENISRYCSACHDENKKEERAAHTKAILSYAAALQANEDYGSVLPLKLKALKRERLLYFAATGLSVPAAALISPAFIFGLLLGANAIMFQNRLEKKLVNEHRDYEQGRHTADMLQKVSQKEFNEAMFEHWEELVVAYGDIEHK